MTETDAKPLGAPRPLRLLVLSGEYAPAGLAGGIGSNLAGMLPALVELGHEVHLLSCSGHQPARDFEHEGVQIHIRPKLRVPGLGRLLGGAAADRVQAALSYDRETRRLDFRPDVVHTADWMAEGLGLALRGRLPLVAYLATPQHLIVQHSGTGPNRGERLADLLERTSVRRAAVVTSTSHLLADDLVEDGWLGDQLPVVIPPPIPLDLWGELSPVERTGPMVLAVGRLEHRKAPDVLIRAAAILAPAIPDLDVVFIGQPHGHRDGQAYGDWLRELAQELGAPCRFLAPMRRAELRELYDRARVVAVPSRYESFSMVSLEAMVAARPIVCTTEMGVSELLHEPGTAVIVAPDDPEALAAGLLPLLEDADYAAEMGRLGREVAAQRCDPADVARRRAAVYERARSQGGPGRKLGGRRRRRHLVAA